MCPESPVSAVQAPTTSADEELTYRQREAAAVGKLSPVLSKRADAMPFPVFHHACHAADKELVVALLAAGLDAGAYPETDNEDDETPLMWVARSRLGDDEYLNETLPRSYGLDIVDVLVKSGADIDEGEPNPLAIAASGEDTGLSRRLINRGASIECAIDSAEDAGAVQDFLDSLDD